MPEEFRDCFVGEKGYDALKKLMRNGNDFCTDIAKCLQERSDAETAYARALRKNGDTLQKLAVRAKGTLFTAFTALGTLISKESEAHSTMANILLTDISIPMKNLAETQYKERKSIEETLNGKFKEWNNAKDIDNKCRSRHFEKSREIEALHLNISSLPKTSRRMARDSTKLTSTPDCKYQANMEMTIQKAEEDLGKIEKKYHNSTKNVEIARQLCAVEMCRGCNQMQKMEYERINEMDKFIQTYVNSIRGFTDTMNQKSTTSQIMFSNVTKVNLHFYDEWPLPPLEYLSIFIDISQLVQMTLFSSYFTEYNQNVLADIRNFIEQAYNLSALIIQTGMYRYNLNLAIEKIHDIIPYHVKYLRIPINSTDQIQIILNRCNHLTQIAFDIRYSNFSEEIIKWFDDNTMNSTYWKDYRMVSVWLGTRKIQSTEIYLDQKRMKLS
ncbi:unnamed protein product [Rotaria sordida]|uniref:F-BAR domain-containing protein n=1 Tax=Rotaria sordida TaxID=392033 RepID=A0A814LV94_9BILA|nr:unnamed protein product [Rotaria sordida]